MRILLANDDGYKAQGINYIKNYLKNNDYDYKICAPMHEMSAMSSSLTIRDYIEITEIEDGLAIDGTPADCVILGRNKLFNRNLDLVLSGINMGTNLSTDIIYSGTVAAAIAGSMGGVKSAAISTDSGFDIDNASDDFNKYFDKAIKIIQNTDYDKNIILNINIPLDNIKGIKVTPMGLFSYNTVLVKHDEKDNHFKFAGSMNFVPDSIDDNDKVHFTNNYMTVTPIKYDLTDYSYITKLEGMIKEYWH